MKWASGLSAGRILREGKEPITAMGEPGWESIMQDVFWIAVTIAFFAVAIAYVHFCERVK